MDKNSSRVNFWLKWVSQNTAQKVAQMLAQKEYEAEHDTLTGLPNRRAWEKMLQVFTAQAKRGNFKLSFLIIDIDGFKKFNDTFGHATGDKALVYISDTIKMAVRKSDVSARLGGDEFGVLLFDTGLGGARLLRARIIDSLVKIKSKIPLSLSIGVSELAKGERAKTAIKRADLSMYHIKRNGNYGK